MLYIPKTLGPTQVSPLKRREEAIVMENIITKLAAISVVSACPNGAGLLGTGVSGGPLANARFRGERLAVEFFGGESFAYEGLGNERPTRASAAVATEDSSVHVAAVAAADAGKRRRSAVASQKQSTTQHQTIQHHSMWAFRGPDPWRCLT